MQPGRLILALAAAVALPAAAADTHYTVVFNQPNGLPANVDKLVADAGGTIVERLPEIGGVGAVSSNPNFAAALNGNAQVRAADPAVQLDLGNTLSHADDGATGNGQDNNSNFSPAGPDPQPMPDSLGNQQWDKMRMNATLSGSYAKQLGRKDVRVAVIDTGVDRHHIDIEQNLDVADSRSFVPTEPDFQDFNGHGTWCASAVAAPINTVGVSGVAPNVTLVSLKVLSGAGSGAFIWLDQALVYAGTRHFDVASMSLGGYIPKCGSAKNPNGCDHADFILLNRAVQFARSNGVLPVAALGNDGINLSDGSFMRDFVESPGEIAGIVGVSATGFFNQKAFYSNYGMGKTDVSAPGGSTRNYTGVPGSGAPPPPYLSLGRLIGAWSSTASSSPSDPREICTGPSGAPPCFLYGFVQGTSMATPNVAGVAALIISQYGDFTPNNQNKPHMSPTQVESLLQQTANNQPCPPERTVVQGPGEAFLTATCSGETGFNDFFGKGIVDALKAVSK
jgi:lantibiotic leader peptide-processing serine protease